MITELITVGTEILLGNIVNTNAQFLAQKCALIGYSVFYQSTVGDNEERLADQLKTALRRSDVVILSGGLGPTEDDLTKETAAKVCKKKLIEDENTKKRIKNYFARTKRKPSDNNWKQALVPEGAIVVDNDNGTAPGIIMEIDGKTIILLPGPPNELIPMVNSKIVPYLKNKMPNTILSAMVKICGIGESKAESMIRDLIDQQTNPTIATYAKTGEVHIRVTASASNEKDAKKKIKPIVEELRKRFGDAIYTVKEEETLEHVVVRKLQKQGLTICTAESCTGGMLSSRLINVPGASDILKIGLVTYSNRAKRKFIDVNRDTLKKYGAVSKETAKEMAKGAVFKTDADVSLAVTGIAGPDGGTKEKPVGTVFIGCYYNESVVVEEFHFTGDRNKIRELTVVNALDLLRRRMLENHEEKNND
ncbi:MAG: competence/damage-inducible protein A [Clostridiales bacterium]|nr:competence/damage-inducible protein A [Clostridiales bacterium]